MKLRVLFVDDHMVFVDAVTTMLVAEPDIDVVAQATTAEDAKTAARFADPDVILLDIDLGATDGIELAGVLLQEAPAAKIVFLTCHDDAATACAAVRAGASGFVPKVMVVQDLIHAIRSVHRGESWIPGRLLTEVLRELQAPVRQQTVDQEAVAHLSSREQEILALLAAGCDRAFIATRLYLSPNTVRTHVKNILSKLDVHSSLEAVGIALRAGLQVEIPK